MELQHNKVERSWRYAIIQVHAQQNNVTLSLNPGFKYDETDTGQGVAVLYLIKSLFEDCHFYLKSESNDDSFNVDIISVPYVYGAPFPGGCCLTCNMEFDPNLVISYDRVETNVTFAYANVYYKRSENSSSVPCDGNKIHPEKSPEHYRLEYDIYLMFLEEGDTSEDTFFKGLQKMAYPAVIKTNGKKMASLKAPTLPVAKFDTHQVGQGVVYNVIVYDPVTNMEAAYSPAVIYAPNYLRLGVVDAVFAVTGSLIGLIFCFFGFRLFKFTLFFGGLANFSIIFFIIIDANSNLSHLGTMLTSAGLGVVFGLLLFALWWFTEWTRICLLFNSLLLGFLIGATLLFTPFGDLDFVQGSDFDYGAIICACTLVFPVILVLWPFLLCVLYTSIVSAYAFIVGIDFFIHTSISFIVIDVILHATKPQYRRDHINVTRPFQRNDYILSATWVFLSFLGCFVQYVMCRNRQFPKSGFIEQKRIRKYFISKNMSEETTPILINSDGQRTYGGNTIC
ncbi:transmembrane 7 superfamily member 3 isoform X2 [Pocillopora verrucosa]